MTIGPKHLNPLTPTEASAKSGTPKSAPLSEPKTPWTPGPWKIDDHAKPDRAIWHGEDCVATAWCIGEAAQDANARLIAEAPAMAELLAEIIRCIEHVDYDALDATVEPTRALLARLGGG